MTRLRQRMIEDLAATELFPANDPFLRNVDKAFSEFSITVAHEGDLPPENESES